MKCSELESLWFAYWESQLRPADQEAFRLHLESCPRCAGLDAKLRGLEVGLESLADAPAEAPPYLKTRILARLDEVRPQVRWWPLRLINSRRLLVLTTACLAFFAGLLARELHRANEWLRTNQKEEVVLELDAPGARFVSLEGDFNGWGSQPGRVRSEKVDGRWIFRVALRPGRYQYSFLVDGKKWLPDPRAAGMIPDGFGGMNSVIYVASDRSSWRM